jgi:hypothetical protein
VVLYKGKHVVLEERALYLALGLVARYSRERLQIRGDNQRLRDLMDHWEQAVKSSLPPGIDVELEERVETREDAAQLAALFAHAEDRVRAFESVVPLEVCNETMELTGTPAAFQGGFKKERLLATLEALRRLLD